MIVGFICEAAEKLILFVTDTQSTENHVNKWHYQNTNIHVLFTTTGNIYTV